MKEIILGTAQFGFDYGINNKRGKIPVEESFKILEEALNAGVNILDTAPLYGESESIIGRFILKNGNKFNIISKLPNCNISNAKEIIDKSLDALNIDSFYGYILHNFTQYKENPAIWKLFERLKEKGKAKKIGFSLYYPYELDYILDGEIKFDLIQLPYNVFDQRFDDYFESLKNMGVEIHVRSAFLQGLVFKNPSELSGNLLKIKDKIITLNTISKETGISIVDICLNFIAIDKRIDKIVVGVDSIDNLRGIIKSKESLSKVERICDRLLFLKENDEKVILPSSWDRVKTGEN